MIKQITQKIFITTFLILTCVFAFTTLVKAEGDYNTSAQDLDKTELTKNLGSYSKLPNVTVGDTISWLIGLIFAISAIVFFFILISGGIKWLTSGGDEKKVAAARSSITNALVGLGIILASWAIVALIGQVFGFQISTFGLKKVYQ